MKIRLEQRPPAKIMGALLQILPILTVLRLVGFFLGRIVKIFERDNVLCIALKVSVFVKKIFFVQYILEHFFKHTALGIYINDAQQK